MKSIILQVLEKANSEIQKVFCDENAKALDDMMDRTFEITDEVARTIIQNYIETIDRALVEGLKKQRRQDGITVKERQDPRTITTKHGDITYRRTYFKMKDGSFCYLVDNLLGVDKYERMSKGLVAAVLDKASDMSFQEAIDTTGQNLSRQTVHNRLIAMETPVTSVERVKETPKVLELFADEDHAHLRKPKRGAIIPLVTITEGIDTQDPKRHRTFNPLHIAGFGMAQSAFNENVLAVLTERYDLDRVEEIRIHADGGNWIQGMQHLIPNSRLIMDGFHAEKYIKRFLRLDGANNYAGAIRKALKDPQGFHTLIGICLKIRDQQTNEKDRKKADEFITYCSNHWQPIVDCMKKDTPGSCTEAQVSHNLSKRLSRNPLAWSAEGLSKMTGLVVYHRNGGRVTEQYVRVRKDTQAASLFKENGYALYDEYARKQANEFMNGALDWSITELKSSNSFGKVNRSYMVLKALGSLHTIQGLAV